MIKVNIGCVNYTVEQFVFPAGEVGVKLQSNINAENVEKVVVKAHIKNSEDVMSLLLVSDAIDRYYPNAQKLLKLPYVPYARQDRVCNEGESLSAAVFAKLINSCGFKSVTIHDPHSDVTSALIDRVKIVSQIDVFRSVKEYWGDTWIVAPDAGAYKKCNKFAEAVNAAGIITCNKVRELSTGKIVGLSCNENVAGKKLFVLDDLCDGGRTFVEIAKLFADEEYSKLELAVTHGLFTKGVDIVTDLYDYVYTTNSYHGDIVEDMKRTNISWIVV